MKKTINFSKAFLPCAIISALIIISGIVSLFTKGINLGIDFKPGSIEEVSITSNPSIDDVRSSLSGIAGVSVKVLGHDENTTYQIRVPAKDSSSDEVLNNVESALSTKFGSGSITVLKTDFIGSQLSKSIIWQSILLLGGTLALIWLYATIRFHWDFALGSIIALVHDMLIMFTFISWTQLEFSTTVLAAVLTIIGYSINATVVILDRIRENLRIMDVKSFGELINKALTDTLSRSIITTVTTLFAVVSLYVFTTGNIKDFALAMIVGLVSGVYSSIFISSGLILLLRKNWKPEFGIHHSLKSVERAKKAVSGVEA